MSETATVPVIAGLAVGIGFILILSLFPVGVSQTTTTLSPVLSLVTIDDGKSYNTHSGIYCGQSCDALIFARVLPLPQIPISNGSEIAFRAINYRGQQVDELHLIIQEIKQEDVAGGSSGGGPNLIETNIQLAKTSNGNYKVENLPAGMYMINVIADWKGEHNLDFPHSLHRFAVKVTTGGNNGNDPSSSSPGEIKTGHPNGTVSIVVIPKGAGSQTGKNFEPSMIKVVIGVNNTVRWTNNDDVLSSVVADNAKEDPDFAAATQFPSGSTIIPVNATNYLQPGQSFEFTFNTPGEIHYHSEPHPWLQGTVIVLPPKTAAAIGNPCLPTSLASINLAPGWVVRQPASLPKGYSLQGVLDNQPADIELLYADHSLCNFPSGFDYQGHQLRIVAVHPGRIINGTENQQIYLAHARDPSSGIVAKVQPIEVKGYKGAGWEQFDTDSTVRLNGTVTHQEPFHGQATLFFFNDSDQMEYSIFGHSNQTLMELLDVARSIK